MSDPVIQVEQLAKRYRLGATQAVGRTFGEMLYGRAARLIGRSAPPAPDKDFWALRDISFQVHAGEVVGIIGRNGAGKSTLLKILSRITDPTEGRAMFRGRLASLLEVGTGFHPELTGRENIYLGGAVQGMRRHEIRAHFDDIVEFSGIEKFIDTPVKRYSSGMYVRLAFAVAAHLQADILLIDEVLAVGDVAFQKKCLGKMQEVATDGRTVLFVSHSLKSVSALCSRGLVLDEGRTQYLGPTDEAIDHYVRMTGGARHGGGERRFDQLTPSPAQIRRVAVLDPSGSPSGVHRTNAPITVRVEYDVRQPIDNLIVTCQVRSANDDVILLTTAADSHARRHPGGPMAYPAQPGRYVASVTFPAEMWNAGEFELLLGLQRLGIGAADNVRDLRFVVTDPGTFVSTVSGRGRRGYLAMPLPWDWQRVDPLPADHGVTAASQRLAQ
jgi:lipopolysaccharide transport system ATP-binding protein